MRNPWLIGIGVLVVFAVSCTDGGGPVGAPAPPETTNVRQTQPPTRIQPPTNEATNTMVDAVEGDLDGDGQLDSVSLPEQTDYTVVVRVELSSGSTTTLEVSATPGALIGTSDVNGDGRDEVFLHAGGASTALVTLLTLDENDRLRQVTIDAGDHLDPFQFHAGSSMGASLGAFCENARLHLRTFRRDSRPEGGFIESGALTEQVYEIEGTRAVLISQDDRRLDEEPFGLATIQCPGVLFPGA